jgi:hypothetical protein
MTKKDFMYITGIEDEETLENIMLLSDDPEPENGDYTELLKKWYENLRTHANNYEQKYVQLLEDFRKMRNKHC